MNIDQEEIKSLPVSVLRNFDDYKIFKNFLKNDLKLEVIRHAKFVLMKEQARFQIEHTINDGNYENEHIEYI